ncbi:MAG: hypothetical protein K6G18_05760 [Treponema sp.]|nr:hypothetical protein [Treponema sp.]MCR5621343.1 hypothetical protein [Treponema sp.]
MNRFILLHLTFLEYSVASIFMKKATLCGGMNIKAFLFFFTGIVLFGGYSILWQQVLKRFPLSVAMANKPVCLLWSTLFGLLIFCEAVSLRFLIGVAFIVTGIVIVSWGKGDD